MRSKSLPLALLVLLSLASAAVPAAAIPGATDRVPAASLLVPFLETGINSSTHPHDTLLVVTNWLDASLTIHWHVWDIDGNATGLSGNVSLLAFDSWTAALRDLITPASGAVKTQLSQGAFYRGFVTVDVVSAPTALNPLQGAYPFASLNALEGFIYYTRLSQGSANGLAMVPLEAVPGTVNSLLRDFYAGGGSREEIDSDARVCAQQLATGAACTGDADHRIHRIHLRHFGSAALSGRSKLVIFAWNTFSTGGGPSAKCEAAGTCPATYPYKRYDENGNVLIDTTVRLDHVVNVIDVAAANPGWVSIWDVPNFNTDTHVYAFSFNSANPAGDPNLTWDAVFEGYIVP
ncbi:MAG TPA: hypothetical protein VF121_17840 [Thermoanaerobaculia bacterium]|nr:hypothetical protein [Thermoanaerobaculia bacterium]